MIQKFEVEGLQCTCSSVTDKDRVAYILYPMDMLADWVEPAARKYGTNIVVITGMDWQNVFSPWTAPGVPKGTADFKGESPRFLTLLQQRVIPAVEAQTGISAGAERSLVGVSMSGLFALWQWMVCDTFANIASLSGSFWYEGFLQWISHRPVPHKAGMGFFLLGDREPKSKVFGSVGANTDAIVELLKSSGIDTEFRSVPGDHYSDPIQRLDMAFAALYGAK